MSDETLKPSFTAGRKWRIGFNVILSCVLLVAILGMTNFLSNRFYYRWTAGAPELTPLTRQLLASVGADVKVIVFFDRTAPLFSSVSTLLRQYKLANPRLQLEFVDYRSPGRAEQIRAEYKFSDQGEGNRVIFDNEGRVKIVHEKELSVYDHDAIFQGREVRRTAFRGEQLFSSALFAVTAAEQPKAYFLKGHGEHDPGAEGSDGYSRFAQILRENNVQVMEFDALLRADIPADCDLLIIAGPKQAFQQVELERIGRYLAAAGRVFLLYNNLESSTVEHGLERVTLLYGINVGYGVVTDPENSHAGDSSGALVISQFGPHQIVAPLGNSSVTMIFPKPVGAQAGKGSADAPNAVDLLLTSDKGIVQIGQRQMTGRVPVAAASEKGGVAGVKSIRSSTRIVAVGDSNFLKNNLLDIGANFDFANLAVNWLLSRDLLLGDIPPRGIEEYRLSLTKAQMRRFRLIFLGAAPGAILLLGGLVWLRRRF